MEVLRQPCALSINAILKSERSDVANTHSEHVRLCRGNATPTVAQLETEGDDLCHAKLNVTSNTSTRAYPRKNIGNLMFKKSGAGSVDLKCAKDLIDGALAKPVALTTESVEAKQYAPKVSTASPK